LRDNTTNSEAISYYLLINAMDKDKTGFDKELEYMKKNMVQQKYGYLMWHLDSQDKPTGTERTSQQTPT